MRKSLMFMLIGLSGLGLLHCGDSSSGCPGIVCTDCGASGDCDVDECQSPEVEFCGAFGYFDDPTLRCAFCAPPDFQP
jgi:hypothetical protein